VSDSLQAFLDAVAEGDDAQTEEMALALSGRGDEAIQVLCDALADPDPDLRWWAVRALAAIRTEAAAQLLILALEDDVADVRACAVLALSQLRAPEAVDPLAARLGDPSAYVGRLTADGLAGFGQPAVAALVRALEEGATAARAGAARALCAIQAEEAIPALYKALDDPSALVTHYAEEALERMGVGTVLFRP
jgi:HEAT repeat protein